MPARRTGPAVYVRPENKITEKDGTPSPEGKIYADNINMLLDRTGGPTFAYVALPNYAKANLPAASVYPGGAMVFVTDDVGGPVPAFNDGVGNWRRVTDRNVIS